MKLTRSQFIATAGSATIVALPLVAGAFHDLPAPAGNRPLTNK